MGILVQRLTADDWRVWRDVRLAALADAPYAFGSSLAREQSFNETDWRARLAPSNGLSAVVLLDGQPVGAIGGYTPAGAAAVLLIAMWARPDLRGRGLGDALVSEVLAWAREQGWPSIELRVADGNNAARRLFLRHGFAPNGRREPLESDPSVDTEWLARPV